MRRWSLALMLLAACGAKPPVRTALQGNLADLKRDISSAERDGKLKHGLVVELAQAVAERELVSASGPQGAERVRTLRACARPLYGTMQRRAERDDDVAAELTSILLEAHQADGSALLERHAHAPSGAWRAVAARAALRPSDTDLRTAFFVDPDPRVRRAALTSAREARAPGELEALLEVARVDPDPLSQSLAVRAAGRVGGERAVLALKDRWARADDTLRMAIVDAWAERASFAAGGARELALAAEGTGLAAVSASSALARAGGAEAALANARLARNISSGTDDEKRLALRVAPITVETEAALIQAEHESSPELRVLALARASQMPTRHDDALRALRAVAKSTPNSDVERRAREAALTALAEAGDTSVTPMLVKNLHDPALATRSTAALALTHLGDYPAVAPALADDDADLRLDLACAILAREAGPH